MRKPSNPFILAGYHSPSYFCDRNDELSWLLDQYTNERNSVLYSWRRMGKTSLVRHFFHQLNKKLKVKGIYTDLSGTVSLAEANKRIAEAIVSQSGTLKKGGLGSKLLQLLGSIGATIGVDPLTGMPNITIGVNKSVSVSTSLEAIGRYITDLKKPVIVCIDEFQQIINYPDENAEATFRSWIQQFPMLRFVFCGSHRHMMISMFSEESRPFYRSAQILELESLPTVPYRKFIRSHFKKAGKTIDDDHINLIFKWTRMQTYYIQLVCNKLYGRTDLVNQDILSETFREMILQEAPLFSSYQQLLSLLQWKLLKAISQEEEVTNPYSQDFVGGHDLGAVSSVQRALKTLINKELVVQDNNTYLIHDVLLMRWLQQL